jgi:hypothetical protein
VNGVMLPQYKSMMKVFCTHRFEIHLALQQHIFSVSQWYLLDYFCHDSRKLCRKPLLTLADGRFAMEFCLPPSRDM